MWGDPEFCPITFTKSLSLDFALEFLSFLLTVEGIPWYSINITHKESCGVFILSLHKKFESRFALEFCCIAFLLTVEGMPWYFFTHIKYQMEIRFSMGRIGF